MAVLIPIIVTVIWVVPVLTALTPLILVEDQWGLAGKYFCIAIAVPIFAITFISVAGIISRFGKKGIVKGTFPRDSNHPVYFLRRIYGTAWTQVYYFGPLYAAILAVPFLRKITFRIFGYTGGLDFIHYPDTWIRDLPMLSLGKGVYLANKSTIGTNMCLSDGTVLVDSINLGDKVLIGHFGALCPGLSMDAGSEICANTCTGIRVKIGKNVSVKPSSTINHGSYLQDGCEIGTMSFIGLRAQIGPGVKIKPGSNIPAGAKIMSQEEADQYFSSETQTLQAHKEAILKILGNHVGNAP